MYTRMAESSMRESKKAFGEALTYGTRENQHTREKKNKQQKNSKRIEGKCVQGIAHRYQKHVCLSIN